jgi:hypothetical protein
VNIESFFLCAGFSILCSFVVLFIIRRTIDKKVNPKEILREIKKEVDGIITELNKTTDRNITLIEEKINQLQETLDKTDKRLSLLGRENEKLGMGKTYSDILANARLKNAATSSAKPEENVRDKILKLYREGFSPQVIASHINMPVGEIELIISLEKGNSKSEST